MRLLRAGFGAQGNKVQSFLEKGLQEGAISRNISTRNADMAQLVEHHLAKVGVAGSNPVVRSIYECRPVMRGWPF